MNQEIKSRFSHIPRWHAPHFSLWKRVFAWTYLTSNGQKINWSNVSHSTAETSVVWGSAAINTGATTQVVRMEDGFIHSLGLGSDLSPPCSQVIDESGIYFDAHNNNDLFKLLNDYDFDDLLLKRAENLRHLIVKAGITKYNLGRKPCTWLKPNNQRVILVIGQVSNDASVRLGTSGKVNSISKMLALVWQNNPDAMVVYKPHPDVLSGNRHGLINATRYCHLVDDQADIISLIEQVDELHTLSSLAGFDALIRGKKVVTYGLPFYAGWGLTEDHVANIPYRNRTVNLDALVAAALVLYPVYWDWHLNVFTTPEATVANLSAGANRTMLTISPFKRTGIKTFRWCANVTKFAYLQFKQFTRITRKGLGCV